MADAVATPSVPKPTPEYVAAARRGHAKKTPAVSGPPTVGVVFNGGGNRALCGAYGVLQPAQQVPTSSRDSTYLKPYGIPRGKFFTTDRAEATRLADCDPTGKLHRVSPKVTIQRGEAAAPASERPRRSEISLSAQSTTATTTITAATTITSTAAGKQYNNNTNMLFAGLLFLALTAGPSTAASLRSRGGHHALEGSSEALCPTFRGRKPVPANPIAANTECACLNQFRCRNVGSLRLCDGQSLGHAGRQEQGLLRPERYSPARARVL